MPTDGRAIVVVKNNHVWLDSKDVGDSAAIAKTGRLTRVDGMFNALKARRESWKTAHPGADFPGVLLLAFDATEGLVVVKSVLQTAAFAGYPNAAFVVRQKNGATAMLPVDAFVPGPPSMDRTGPTVGLVVEVTRANAVASWRERDKADKGDGGVSLGGPASLGAMAQAAWREHGEHRGPQDHKFDQAFVYADNDVPFSALVASLDELLRVERDWEVAGKIERVPALNATLMVTPPRAGSGVPTSGGRLPPEIIQRIVRANFSGMRTCYEAGLRRSGNLNGKVEVRFVIERDGRVSSAKPTEGTALVDNTVVQCVVGEFSKLTFPEPEGGTVIVVYPIIFNPGD